MTPPTSPILRIAVLVSGEGTGLQNLIDRIADGRLPDVRIELVIASRANAGAVSRASQASIPVEIISPKSFPGVDQLSLAIDDALNRFTIDLAVQAGWLCYWKLPPHRIGRVINIHPALLPKFGGKGCYGRRVHEAVLAAREGVSGATVHWVDNEYDHGQIIAQRACPVLADDTPETLAARVQAVEFELLPEVINQVARQEQDRRELSP